ncbi:MAG: lipocalin family protein [Bacteroidia bacterium]|nr:lipocalin family protein [Bacteroidia bacterium]
MKRPILISLLFACLVTNCQTQTTNTMIDKSTVNSVDLNRYLGKWYEIARFDHSFEKGLVGVTATYSLRTDGKIKVLNEGYKDTLNGKHKVAVGKAKIANPKDLSKLKVSFFLNFYADYLIMELDQVNYQYALIGSKSANFLWILSRTPSLHDSVYNMLLEKANKRGYDINALIKVPQL